MNLDVDAILERARQLGIVGSELRFAAFTCAPRVCPVATRTRIGRRDQRKSARKGHQTTGARDPYDAFLRRPPQRIEDLPPEQSHFVEEQHTVVPECWRISLENLLQKHAISQVIIATRAEPTPFSSGE
jgi:hypothetical protein